MQEIKNKMTKMYPCWRYYVDPDGCEDQTQMRIAVNRLDTERRHLVAVALTPGDHNIVAGEIPGLEFG